MYDSVHKEIRVIQKWWRSYTKFNLANSHDVFTLEPIDVKNLLSYHCYVYDNKTKQKYIFDSFSLIQYVLTTGNISNPYTRKDFSLSKLKYIYAKYLKHNHFLSLTYKHEKDKTVIFDKACNILNEIQNIKKHHKIIKEEEEYFEFLMNEINTSFTDIFDYNFFDNQLRSNQLKFLQGINYTQDQLPAITELFKHLKLYNLLETKQNVKKLFEEKVKAVYEFIYANNRNEEDLIWSNNLLIFIEEIILRELDIIFD